MHMKIYTGIGSRETPDEVLKLMLKIGATLGQHGWVLRSGHAPGADQAFEAGATLVRGPMEVYLPWEGFEGASSVRPGFMVLDDLEAERVAAMFHPAWHRCSPGSRKMHQRNVHQVAGRDLSTPSDLIICWTKGGKRQGGTDQALRIADYLKIPIFDLAVCRPEDILEYVNHGALPLEEAASDGDDGVPRRDLGKAGPDGSQDLGAAVRPGVR